MQKRSSSIAELAAALAAAQGQMLPASKDSLNPHFGSAYAGLSSIWSACRGPLSANGIAVVQTTSADGPKAITTTTMLHKSGEWIEDDLAIPVANPTAQALGSAFSYGRRYSLAGITGVAAQDDDDGEAATGRETAAPAVAQKIRRPIQKAPPQPPVDFPWNTREEMTDAFEALRPFVSTETFENAIAAHEITVGADGRWHGTKRKFVSAYQTLESLAALKKGQINA